MLHRILRMLLSVVFGAIYAILFALVIVALAGVVVGLFSDSQPALIVFGSAFVFLAATIVAISRKPVRTRIAESQSVALPVFFMNLVLGTAAGMAAATLTLLLGQTHLAVAAFFLLSMGLPVSAVLLEWTGLLKLLDGEDLPELFDD